MLIAKKKLQTVDFTGKSLSLQLFSFTAKKRKNRTEYVLFRAVKLRKMGLEPTRHCCHKILSLARLPVPTLPHAYRTRRIISLFSPKVNYIFTFCRNPGFFLFFTWIFSNYKYYYFMDNVVTLH